ncbi:protein-L-isoaspartate(D-aspartate) O-methyltransferase [uncultured Sphingomonas sp.]|uniref:protein-L-isoaspartate(D-aspartate) O-methyltransferase n=1 Tax=uncultured Sphingomonas sp. TaxID=158754 RepID=UPI0025CD8511|nr:protein-L-isoaspartate(D-aspartate) O-methyltransferase [uncultured Sphingomonas sp.]
MAPIPMNMDDTTRPGLMRAVFRGGALLLAALPSGVAAKGTDHARVNLVATIRHDIRQAAPAADDAELAKALGAVATVPRESFVPPEYRRYAYASELSLPIGYDQTISDPYIVALMTASAHVPVGGNVLDVGTGSGYQAAVLGRIATRVTSVEIVAPLAAQATARLAALGYRNVEVRTGDGFAGAPDRAPFDAIIVAAGSDRVPQPLLDQLKPGGRLVMPVGATWVSEQLLVVTRTGAKSYDRCSLGLAMFVPLTGRGERSPRAAGLIDRSVPLCYGTAVVFPVFVKALPKPDRIKARRTR